MVYAGLDLSRRRLDVHVLDADGDTVEEGAAAARPRRPRGLRRAARARSAAGPGGHRVDERGPLRPRPARAAGWEVEIADAQKVKGLAPLACKTDRIDAWVLAELCRRDLVPAIWLPDPRGAGRARAGPLPPAPGAPPHRAQEPHPRRPWWPLASPARCRTCSASAAARCSSGWRCPSPGRQRHGQPRLIDDLDRQIDACERALRRLGADHPYVPLLTTIPGIAWVLGYTIAAEIGDIERFASPKKLAGYSGLCPRVHQSGERDRRGPLAKNGPKYLRWALIEAAQHAAATPPTASSTSAPSGASAKSAAPRSPIEVARRSPRRSGRCSPETNRLLRQAPRVLWPHDGPD